MATASAGGGDTPLAINPDGSSDGAPLYKYEFFWETMARGRFSIGARSRGEDHWNSLWITGCSDSR
eukprot:2747450-Pyramimonas_sp.AAC.1